MTSPRPWKFRGSGLRDANDRVIMLTVPGALVPVAEDDANRRVIENAAEMREALRGVIAEADRNTVPFIKARALLAKLENT